jgi:hypothetical protein
MEKRQDKNRRTYWLIVSYEYSRFARAINPTGE